MSAEKFAKVMRTGYGAIIVLAEMTIVEFVIAITTDGGVLYRLLTVIAIAKAWIIFDYFMHITHLWRPEH
jgi:hypothetical protein